MDHSQRKTDINPVADEEALSAVSKQEDDLEWKQFIQKELEKLENQEKDEGKEDSEKTSSVGTGITLSSLIERIPLEKLIDLAIRSFKKKIELKKTKPKKTKSEKTELEKPEPEKTEPKKQNRIKEIDQRGVYKKESKVAIPKENDCRYRPPYSHDAAIPKENDCRYRPPYPHDAAIPKENDCRYRPPYPHDEVSHPNGSTDWGNGDALSAKQSPDDD